MLSSVIAFTAMGALSAPSLSSLESALQLVAQTSPRTPSHLQSQTTQTEFALAEAIAVGVARNPRLAAERERVNAARGRLMSARAIEPPMVTAGPSIGGESATPIVTQKFEISGRLRARAAVATHELLVAEMEYVTAERDLVRDIRTAYAELGEAQDALAVSSEVEGVILRIRDSVRKQVEVGQMPVQDLVKADIELSRAQLDSVRARSSLERTRFAFNETLGRHAGAPARASEPAVVSSLGGGLDTLTTDALATRPEIAAGQAAIAAAKANIGLQRSDLRPDLDLSLLANTDLKSSDFMRSRSVGLGLTLAFPLFDTGRIRGRVREAEAEARALESELLAIKLHVTREVADAFSRVQATESLVIRYEKEILPGAKELLTKAEFGYGRGALTLLDFLEAQRTHKATRFEYLAALTQYAKARADLDRAVGRRLTP